VLAETTALADATEATASDGQKASVAESTDALVGERPAPRREVTLGLGYGAIVSPRAFRNDADGRGPTYDSTMTGWMIEVTGRRFATFEYGLLAWSTGGSSDGRGSYAHVLLRIEAEARWLPWGFGRIEPWLGVELGVAAADDYVKWDSAVTGTGSHSASLARPGYIGGVGAGLRGRAGELVAFGLRGGLLYLGLARSGPVKEPGNTGNVYLVRPTDYGRHLWYSVMLSAEITVSD
jgi:hypothetical protein